MARKLSARRSRADIIANFKYAPPATPPTDPPAKGPYEPAPYDEKPDETVVCPSCSKHNDTDASFCDQCGFQLKGSDDVKIEPPADAPAEDPAKDPAKLAMPFPPARTPPAAAAPPAAPIDEQGNADDAATCMNPDCGHLASAHTDTQDGKNRGGCSMQNCACPLFREDDGGSDDDTSDQGDDDPAVAPGDDGVTATRAGRFAPAIIPMPPAAAPPPEESAENVPPPVAGGESMGPAFTIPVAVIEGQPTGDGREIAPGALTWRVPPVPLMGLATETHDPEGFDMNSPAVMCGRIDSFERVPGDGDTQLICAKGFYLPNDDGMYFAELNEAMGRLGVSADIAVQASEVTIEAIDAEGFPLDMSDLLTQGTLMGVTVCPFPAFEGAYIVLGDGTEQPEAIPQTTDKVPALAASGQRIHLIAYEDCEPCTSGIEIVASGGPTAPPAAWFADPGFTEGDGRLVEILDRRGKRALGGKFACPVTVEDNGRVFGHIAPWEVCRVGMPGCVVAPHSAVDYAHFKRGQHVITAEGEKIRVGVLTADAGHASVRGITAAAAMAHYDNTALAFADVNIGEDEHGIWIAGAVRPDATEEQVRKLRAASVSGDWRAMGGQLELVAALCVNQPGFPLAVVDHEHGQVGALVAAGGNVMHALKHPAPPAESGDVALRAALAPMLHRAKAEASERLAVLRR